MRNLSKQKDGNYRCKLMREIDSINGKIEDAMDGK